MCLFIGPYDQLDIEETFFQSIQLLALEILKQ